MIWIYDRLESAISCYSLRALKRAQSILPQLKYSSLKMPNLSLFWGGGIHGFFLLRHKDFNIGFSLETVSNLFYRTLCWQ